MKGTVKIGEKEVGMVANAASPYIYKQIFHEDFLAKMQEGQPDADLFQKMGFVMAKQYELEKMSELMKLTVESFYEWLMEYDAMEIILATDKILEIYMAQAKSSSVPKK